MSFRPPKRRRVSKPSASIDVETSATSSARSSKATTNADDSGIEEVNDEELSFSDNGSQEIDPEDEGIHAAEDETLVSSDQERGSDDVSLEDGSDDGTSDEEEDADMDVNGDTALKHTKTPSKVSNNATKHKSRIQATQKLANGSTELSQIDAFSLQAEEMLRHVTPKYGEKDAPADQLLRSLKQIIESIESTEPLTVKDAEKTFWKQHKTRIPSNARWPRDVQYKLQFSKPASVNVVGSYALQTATISDSKVTIDLVVTMPSTLFTEKDYLNNRFLHKRAFYVATIAAAIKRSAKQLGVLISYVAQNGNTLLPAVLVSPTELEPTRSRPRHDVCIVVAMSEGFFPIDKLLPTKNCLRKDSSASSHGAYSDHTPFYNSVVQANSCMTSYLRLLYNASKSCAAFKEACMLGRIWLQQRGFDGSLQRGGIGNFEFSAFLALLLKGGGPGGRPLLASTYSSQQLLKASLNFIAQRDLIKQPLVIGDVSIDGLDKLSGGPMVFDGERGLNIFFKVSQWNYQMLRLQAQLTIRSFRRDEDDLFEKTFILKVAEPLLRFDLILQLEHDTGETFDDTERASDCIRILRKGLGDRIQSLDYRQEAVPSWSCDRESPEKTTTIATIGIELNGSNASRSVDRGPPVEEKEATAAFSEFWGERAELRRFKDGSILHSVIWKGSGAVEITKEIITYLVTKHALSDGDVALFGNEMQPFGPHTKLDQSMSQFDTVMAMFSSFEKDLRELEELPLSIRQIQSCDSLLSYTSLELSGRTANVVVQFEGSARWPDNLPAIQMTKVAFLLKLQAAFETSHTDVIARVGVENEESEILNQSFLDVTYPAGVTFRLRIHHDRESTLLEQQMKNRDTLPSTRLACAHALSMYKRDFLRRPLHTSAIRSLSTRFSAFSGTTRLLKKWFSAHLLSPHFSEPLLELIAAKAFVSPEPWLAPSTAQTGFLRTLLLLSRWDWANDPLIVNLAAGATGSQNSLSNADTTSIRTRFQAWRKLDPQLARVSMFVGSNIDHDGETWTDGAPHRLTASRMTALARAAMGLVMEKGLTLNLNSLFKAKISDYDFKIVLSPDLQHSSEENALYKNLASVSAANTKSNFVSLYLAELQSLYGEAVIFFHDASHKHIIAGLWNQQAEGRRWKLNLPFSSTISAHPEADGAEATAMINRQAMLSEMARLGGDMVVEII